MTAEGAREAHLRGFMHAGRLTPEGVRAALSFLSDDLTPPLSKQSPQTGQGGNDDK